jgi:serine protease Do
MVVLLVSGCSQQTGPADSEADGDTAPLSFAETVEKAMPSVVYIFTELQSPRPGQFGASGSGVIMDPRGYILTNRHVVEGARRAEVTLQDRSFYEVTDIWLDDTLDLAVIKIDAQDLTAIQFADPDEIQVGDWAIALGHPLGISPTEGGATVTVGVVSNLGRSFAIQGVPYYDIIQTDAAINPGNSGGPLVNLDGEVIGINSAGDLEAQNINYAINVATARRVYEDIIQYGRVVRPYLGAVLNDITPDVACELCLAKRVGAIIMSVEPGGPADAAGLKANDILIKFGDIDVISAAQLVKELWRHEVGKQVEVTFWREETEQVTTVTLAERPSM